MHNKCSLKELCGRISIDGCIDRRYRSNEVPFMMCQA